MPLFNGHTIQKGHRWHYKGAQSQNAAYRRVKYPLRCYFSKHQNFTTTQYENTGAKDEHRKCRLWMSMETKPRLSRGNRRAALYNSHVSTTSSTMSFKSSLTLTTPKERKEG